MIDGPMHVPRRPVRRRFCFGLAAMLLGACAAPASRPTGPAGSVALAAPATAFTLTGRLSVRVDDRIDAGSIRWERSAAAERIDVFTPLGSQVAALTRDAEGRAELRRGDEVRLAASLAELTASLFGVALDLERIARWMQGHELDGNGHGTARSSDGRLWDIEAEGIAAGIARPIARRLTLVNGGTVVKLVIDSWEPA